MNKATEITYGIEAQREILSGLVDTAEVVAVTLGPKGRVVFIESPGHVNGHRLTKDGVTVATSVHLKGSNRRMGSALIKNVAEKTGNFIGDGTTTAAILKARMCAEGFKAIEKGVNPVGIKRGVELAVKDFQEMLEPLVIKITPETQDEMIRHVAKISANGDMSIANVLTQAINTVGKEGIIVVDKNIDIADECISVDGFRINEGFVAHHFINNNRAQCELNDCAIIVIDQEVSNFSGFMHLLEHCGQTNKSFLIIAHSVEGLLLKGLIENKLQGIIKCCAIKAPDIGETRRAILEDICTATGATLITAEAGKIKGNIDISYLGNAKRVIINRLNTTIIEGNGDKEKIAATVSTLDEHLVNGGLNAYQKTVYRERKSCLLGKLATIKVGGTTDSELSEKLDRVDDAIHATKSALTNGYVPGGGATMYALSHKLSEKLEDSSLLNEERIGYKIVIEALKAPITQIISNAGDNVGKILKQLPSDKKVDLKNIMGYNAETGEIVNILESNIIDPYEVTKGVVNNSSVNAVLFLNTGASIVNEDTTFEQSFRNIFLAEK